MVLKLVVTTNVNGDVFELNLKRSKYRVGRSRDNDLRIEETYVSGHHSELNRNECGDYEVKDCGSSNGTFLNGRRVEKPQVVKAGDFIKFGILKVAVVEAKSAGHKVVSLKDRPAFAKKRDEMTAAIPVDSTTRPVGDTDISADSQPISKAPPPLTEESLKEVEVLLEKEKKKSKGLNSKLSLGEKEIDSLNAELEKVRKELKDANAKSDDAGKSTKKESEQLSKLEKEAADLQSKLNEATTKAEDSAKELDAKSAELDSLHDEIKAKDGDLHSALSAAEAKAEEAKDTLRARDTEVQTLAAELDSIKESLSRKESELKATAKKAAKLAALTATVEHLKSDLSASSKKSKTAQKERSKLKKELSEKSSALEKTTGELAELKASVKESPQSITASEEESGGLAQLREEFTKAKSEAEEKISSLEAEKEFLSANLSEKEKSTAELEQAHAALKKEKEQLTADLAAIEQEKEVLSNDLDARDESIAEQKTELETLGSELDETAARLTEADSGKQKESEAVTKLRQELEEARNQSGDLESKLAEREKSAEKAENEAAQLRKKIEAVRAEAGKEFEEPVSKLEAQLPDTESKADEEKNSDAETASRLAEALALVAALKTSQQDNEAKLSAFKESSDQVTQEAAAAKGDLMSDGIARYFGIDLGTSTSALAYIRDDGNPEIVPNSDGERLTPSVVFFDPFEGVKLVGSAAKDGGDPDRTVRQIKKFMDDPSYVFEIDGERWTPAEISALFLAKLRKGCAANVGPIDEVVITVPANFNELARKATVTAGRLAGLTVRRIVNEPTAAALYYAHTQSIQGRIMVYDLGGGTLDITVLDVRGDNVDVLLSEGARHLGGSGFDTVLIELIGEEYKAQNGRDLVLDDSQKRRLLGASDDIKKHLSKLNQVSEKIGNEDAGINSVELSLERVEDAIRGLLTRTVGLVEQALDSLEMTTDDIDHVVLVGGSTRIPRVQELLTKQFGHPPISCGNVDECVALGAALFARKVSRMSKSAITAAELSLLSRTPTPAKRMSGTPS